MTGTYTQDSVLITGIKPRRGKRTPRKDSRPPIRTLILAFSILGDEDPTKNPRTYFVRILCACACIVLLFFLFMVVFLCFDITFRDFYNSVMLTEQTGYWTDEQTEADRQP